MPDEGNGTSAPGDSGQSPGKTRKEKLWAVEELLQLAVEAERAARVARVRISPAHNTLQTEITTWKTKLADRLLKFNIDPRWAKLVALTAQTHIGFDLAQAYLGVLKWRLLDRLDDELDESTEARIAAQCWLQVWGTRLSRSACSSGGTQATFEEQRSFSGAFKSSLQVVSEWAESQEALFGNLVRREIRFIEIRVDDDDDDDIGVPSDAPAWHIGWSMTALAWLMAGVSGNVLPLIMGTRTCQFDQAQQARVGYCRHGTVYCPRCKSEVHVQRRNGGQLQSVNAICKACELLYYFPEQADPESIWSGPQLTRHPASERASNRMGEPMANSPSETKQPAEVAADPKKVFIIHGRNTKAAKEMANFVRAMGLKPIDFNDLRAQMGGTPTIADIVTRGMDEAWGVIALFTGDERAELRPELVGNRDRPHEIARWQARPNVVFEAGMAFGRDRKRVVLVLLGDVELFTDVVGIHVFRPTNDPGGDRSTLQMTLKNMGCDVDDTTRAWMTTGDFDGVILAERDTRSAFGSNKDLPAVERDAGVKLEADRRTIRTFAAVIDSEWMTNFKERQMTVPQRIDAEELDVLFRYEALARNPENSFWDGKLQRTHDVVLEAIAEYKDVSATERVPTDPAERAFEISTKSLGRERHVPDYDQKYRAQVDMILVAVRELWAAWCEYARLAKLFEVANQVGGSV